MPDISKCLSQFCKKRHKCWRYTSKSGIGQSYGNFNHENCEYFWDNSEMVKEEREIINKGRKST